MTGSTPPLDGIRVVGVEQAVAGPMCTRHLADLGAQVIKIEKPGGDFARQYDSVVNGLSSYFVWLNYGKQSVELDLSTVDDRSVFDSLLKDSDVLVHNLGPGAMDRLGYTAASLKHRFPTLINCCISGYGKDGPFEHRKAFDLLVQGEAGVMAISGPSDQPGKVALPIADIAAAMYALSSVLAALFRRQKDGGGAAIETVMLDCLAEWMTVPMYFSEYEGLELRNAGPHHATIAPYGPYRTTDGFVNLAVQNQEQWTRLCTQVLGDPSIAKAKHFLDNESRVAHRIALDALLNRRFRDLQSSQLMSLLLAADVPCGNVNSVKGLRNHPQLEARMRWGEVSTHHGPATVIRNPFNHEEVAAVRRDVPDLGEHNAMIRDDESMEVDNGGYA